MEKRIYAKEIVEMEESVQTVIAMVETLLDEEVIGLDIYTATRLGKKLCKAARGLSGARQVLEMARERASRR